MISNFFAFTVVLHLTPFMTVFYFAIHVSQLITALNNCNKLDLNWRLPPLTVVLFAYTLAIEMFSIRLSEAKEKRIGLSGHEVQFGP